MSGTLSLRTGHTLCQVVWVLGVSQADSTYRACGKGGPNMFRAVCRAEAFLRLSPLPEDLGRDVWSQGTKAWAAGEEDGMYYGRQKA